MRHQTIKILWKMPNSCSPNVRPNNNTKNKFSDFQNSNSDLFQNLLHYNLNLNIITILFILFMYLYLYYYYILLASHTSHDASVKSLLIAVAKFIIKG